MSDALTDAQMLSIWERGAALGTTERALLTIGTADPEAETAQTSTWPLGRRDTRLLEIRRATFGDAIHFRAACPSCTTDVEFDVDVLDLRRGDLTAVDIQERIGAVRVVARLPTSEDALAIERCGSSEAAEAILWERCVRVFDDDRTAIPAAALSRQDREQIEALLDRADPQTDVAFDLRCPECSAAWTAPCDVAGLLWQEVTQCARDVLAQASALARAFGWTESDILALSWRRREMYLAAVG